MEPMNSEPRVVPAPELPPAEWVNTPAPLTLTGLRGQVVLADFWDCTSIDCLRSLPYKRTWHERYADQGLTLIGIHTPRYGFARDRSVLASAAGRLGIRWPIVLDNDGAFSSAFATRHLPAVVLIDPTGRLRYRFAGECGYAQTERALQALLAEIHPTRSFPDPLQPVCPEDAPGAVCPPTTAELHADSLGNAEFLLHLSTLLQAPAARVDGRFYLDGQWRASAEGLTLTGENGTVHLPYHAASVYAVFSPTPDPVAWSDDLHPAVEVQLTQDDLPLPLACFAEDVFLAEGHAHVRVDRPRLYALVHNRDVRPRQLRLDVRGSGLTLYAFSFGTRADSMAAIESRLSQSHPHPVPME